MESERHRRSSIDCGPHGAAAAASSSGAAGDASWIGGDGSGGRCSSAPDLMDIEGEGVTCLQPSNLSFGQTNGQS